MVRLLRVLIRMLFRAAAIAAVVWIGRELMRRWVNGPEQQPQVAGGWETWQPDPSPTAVPAAAVTPPAAKPAAAPAKKARAKKAAAPAQPAARRKPTVKTVVEPTVEGADAPGPTDVPDPAEAAELTAPDPVVPPQQEAAATPPAAAGPPPAKRRARPLKATRIARPERPRKAAPAAQPAQDAPDSPEVEPAKAAGPTEKKVRRKAALPAWVSPNGTGEAPATHPVKAKLISRLYRLPGMPMYNRVVPDRCYTTPEAAEADGFTRAAR